MDCLSKFSEIKENFFKIFVSKSPEDEKGTRKLVNEIFKNVPQLYGFAEMWLSKSEVHEVGGSDEIRRICIDLLNDTAFLKAALEEKHLDPETYFGVLESLSAGGFACLHDDAKKEIAGILFSSEEMQECCRYRINDGNKKFVSLILALDPESDKMAVVKRIAGMMLKSSDINNPLLFVWEFLGRYEKLLPKDFLNKEKLDELILFVTQSMENAENDER